MSLKGKFKTDSALTRDGAWFELAKNSDGTTARIRLRRYGRSNKDWVAAYRDETKDVDLENISPEEDEAITVRVFTRACVVDWEHMQPEDDGNNIPFSKDAALALFIDPEWNDLFKECQAHSQERTAFQAKQEKELGNS